MKPSVFGKPAWTFLFLLLRKLGKRIEHDTTPEPFIEGPTECNRNTKIIQPRPYVMNALRTFGSILPCCYCRESFGWLCDKYLFDRNYPAGKIKNTKEAYYLWFEIHNFVNRKLDKPVKLNASKYIREKLHQCKTDTQSVYYDCLLFLSIVFWNKSDYNTCNIPLKTCNRVLRLCVDLLWLIKPMQIWTQSSGVLTMKSFYKDVIVKLTKDFDDKLKWNTWSDFKEHLRTFQSKISKH